MMSSVIDYSTEAHKNEIYLSRDGPLDFFGGRELANFFCMQFFSEDVRVFSDIFPLMGHCFCVCAFFLM